MATALTAWRAPTRDPYDRVLDHASLGRLVSAHGSDLLPPRLAEHHTLKAYDAVHLTSTVTYERKLTSLCDLLVLTKNFVVPLLRYHLAVS